MESNLSKIVNFCLCTSAGWWIDTDEEPVAVHIRRTDFDVTTQHLPSTIRGRQGKLRSIQLDSIDGGVIVRLVLRSSDSPVIDVGISSDKDGARRWAKDLNDFIAANSKVEEFFGRFWDSPVMREIIKFQTIYYLPGRYIPYAQPAPWQTAYLKNILSCVKDELRTASRSSPQLKGIMSKVQLKNGALIHPVSYRWLVENIAFPGDSASKIMVPLEMIFQTSSRRAKIDVLPIANVKTFRFAWFPSNPSSYIDSIVSSALLSADSNILDHSSLTDALNKLAKHNDFMLSFPSNTSIQDMVLGMVFNGSISVQDNQIIDLPNEELLADRMERQNKSSLLVFADVGHMNKIMDVLIKRSCPTPSIGAAKYPNPLRAGLSVRGDDEYWTKILKQSWEITRSQIAGGGSLLQDFIAFAHVASTVGIDIDLDDYKSQRTADAI